MSRAILLIDMDAFYASVEQARRPELVGLPVIVGGSAASRGVVSTASYEARAYGVRTAMPTAQAQRLCPQGVFLPVDMKAYAAVSKQLLEILGRFTDLVEPVSIDEAFLDVTGSRRLFGSPQEIARQIQELVRGELGLSCSIGIGPTRLLAKLAAELDKPGGLTTLSKDDVHGRLRELPVRKLYGIGPVTEERLRSLGLTTIGRLQDVPLELLASAFPTGSAALKELAFGGSDECRARRSCCAQVDGSRGHLRLRHQRPRAAAGHPARPRRPGDRRSAPQGLRLSHPGLEAARRALSHLRRTAHPGGRDQLHQASSTRPPRPCLATCTQAAAGCACSVSPSAASRNEARQLELDDSWREAACDEAVDRVRAKYGAGALRRAGAAPGALRPGP